MKCALNVSIWQTHIATPVTLCTTGRYSGLGKLCHSKCINL